MATTAATIIAKRRRDIVSHFLSANAVSAESAAVYEPERAVDRRQLAILIRKGIVVEAGDGRYYVDVPVFDHWNRSIRRKVGLALLALVAVAGGAAALGG